MSDRALRRLPARAVLRRALRLLRVRDLDRPSPPHRRATSTACRRRRRPPVAAGMPAATSVFVGGGTPSLVPAADLVAVLDRIPRHRAPRSRSSATPTTSPPSWLDTYRAGGVNRLSLRRAVDVRPRARGARSHPRPRQRRAVAWRSPARRASTTFNLDLIYGGAGETLDDWCRTLDDALALDPPHVVGLRPHRRGGHAAGRRSRRATPTTTTRPTSTSPPPSASAPPGSSGTRSRTGPGPATSAGTTSCTGRWASTRASVAPPTPTAPVAGSGTSAPPTATSTRVASGAVGRRRPTSGSTPTPGSSRACS